LAHAIAGYAASMTARGHFQVIWRRRWYIVLASLLIAGAVYGFTTTRAKTYQAQAQLLVTPGQTSSNQPVSQTDTVFLASTYAQLGTTRPIIQDALQRSRLHITEQTAAKRITVSASSQVGFITVAATGPSTGDATALARGEVQALTGAVTAQQTAATSAALAPVQQQIAQLGNQLAALPPGSAPRTALEDQYQALIQSAATRQLAPVNQLNVISPARAGSSPISPTPLRDSLLALLTAVVVTSELSVGIELLGDRFANDDQEEEVSRVTGLPILANVPRAGGPEVVEAFRTLRTNLLFMESGEQVKTIAVVSHESGSGKSFTSINLAMSIAELGIPTALVDGDMRRPAIDGRLGVSRSPGLSDVLHGGGAPIALHQNGSHPNLWIMPAGGTPADPAGLLGRQLGPQVFSALPQPHVFILDTPAQAVFPDALVIAVQCDATVVVVDPRLSRRRAVRATIRQLGQVNARLIGVVLNRTASPGRQYGGYHYRSRRSADRVPSGS
jgi:polysaccharide biosynthesis transport protein